MRIKCFEHDRLVVRGPKGLQQKHKDALDRLNEQHKGRYFESIHRGVKFSQYVGVIQFDDLVIEIHPKADRSESNDRWRNVLLNMLVYTGRIRPETAGMAQVNRRKLNLIDLYFHMYLDELDKLIRLGLVKQYRKETSNSLALKGRLEFAGHLRQNLIHKERFYTTHSVYDQDHALHTVLAHALDIVTTLSRGTSLSDYCQRIAFAFPEIQNRRCTPQLLQSLKLNRKTAGYESALEIARLIILNYSPDIQAGKQKMLALLFDMNDLWERFITKALSRHLTEHESEFSLHPQEEKVFWKERKLKPDIVLYQNGQPAAIIDTKWKTPKSDRASMQDLRQMYAYGRFWECGRSVLLYPGVQSERRYHSFRDAELPGLNEVKCKLSFIDVVDAVGKLRGDVGSDIFDAVMAHQTTS